MPNHSLVLLTAHDNGSVTTGPLMRPHLDQLTDNAANCVRQFTRQCADAVIAQPARHGFTDVDIVHVPAIADGARWRSYLDTDRTGVLPDPATTPAAVAAVASGHTIAATVGDSSRVRDIGPMLQCA